MKNEVFDTDKYIDALDKVPPMDVIKPPNNKVPANNLPKLAPEKKIVPITVDIPFGDFILRDHFDWDLN